MPDVPSADEVGLPGYEVRSWFGMFAPAKTPPAVIDRVSREIKKASTDPKFVAALAPQGMQIVVSSPDEMAQSLREDSQEMGRRDPRDRHDDQSIEHHPESRTSRQGIRDDPPSATTAA